MNIIPLCWHCGIPVSRYYTLTTVFVRWCADCCDSPSIEAHRASKLTRPVFEGGRRRADRIIYTAFSTVWTPTLHDFAHCKVRA